MNNDLKTGSPSLGELLNREAQYIIPLFQRGYRWERRDWRILWNDLVSIQTAPENNSHFMGILVMEAEPKPGGITRFYLVDGQQRLTTASILLAAIRNIAEKSGHDKIAKRINDAYLLHADEDDDNDRYRLFPKDRDRSNYLALVSDDGVIHRPGNMSKALKFFTERVREVTEGGKDVEKLKGIRNAVIHRLQFVTVLLPSTEASYAVFKSMNSTGVPLGQSDLIRNFMFMNMPPKNQDAYDKKMWQELENVFANDEGTLGKNEEGLFSQFFRHSIIAKGKYIQPEETFKSFEEQYEEEFRKDKDLSRLRGVTADLIKEARHYSVIRGWSTELFSENRSGNKAQPAGSNGVIRALGGLNDLKSSTTYPLLLALFAKRAESVITDKELARCIEMLRGFIFRRYICGKKSNSHGKIFAGAIEKIKKSEHPVDSLSDFLQDEAHPWPDDDVFKRALVRFPLYEGLYAKATLAGLEQAREHKEYDGCDGATIEHIMPQDIDNTNADWHEILGDNAKKVHAEWCDCLGNLTLTGYNPELSNDSFSEKCKIYEESHFEITKDIPKNFSKWGEAEIRKRGEQLAEEAARIWVGPSSKS